MTKFCGVDAVSKKTFYWVGIAILLSGCGGNSASSPTPKKETEQAVSAVPETDPKSGASTDSSTRGKPTPAPSTPLRKNDSAASKDADAQTKVPAGNSTPTEPTPNSNNAKSSQPASAKPASQAPIKLSDTQLAQWKRPAYETLELLAFRQSASVGFVDCMAYSPDGKHFVLAGTKVTLWSLTNTEPEHVFLDLAGGGKEQTIKSLAISPDGKWVAAGDSEGALRIWDLAERKERTSKRLGSTGITQIAISPDSQELATTSYTSEVTIWSAETLEKKHQLKVEAGLKQIRYMAKNLLVAAAEKTTLWDVSEGKLVKTLSPGRYNASLAGSKDGKSFAFGDMEGLRIWDVSQSAVSSTFLGAAGANSLVDFSPDGKLMAIFTGARLSIVDIARNDVVQVIDSTGWATVGIGWLPESNVLIIAKEDGTIRFWGNAKCAESLDLKPMHKTVPTPDSSSKTPASPAQLLQAIDLRSFPKLPGAVPLTNSETSLSYEAASSLADALLFYRYTFGGMGWSETPPNPAAPNYLQFDKNGFKLMVSLSDSGKGTNVNLVNLGNYDLRWAPRFDGAPVEVSYENESTILYKTKAELLAIETNLLRKMHEAGWTAYSRLNSSHNEETDSRQFAFVQNGLELNVSVSKFPPDLESFNVSYSASTTLHSIPIPKDCGFVEFSSATEPLLVANTTMDLAQTREFYEREMQAQGWLPRTLNRTAKEDRDWLSCFRGQQDITIAMVKRADGLGTLIQVGTGFENSSWQLAKPKEQAKSDKPAVGIEAADFPILNVSKESKIDVQAKTIDVVLESTALKEVDKQYTQALSGLGWKVKDGGIRDDDYLFITFAKDRTEIALRARMMNGNASANFQGDGLLWSKPLAGGKKRISYESWLRNNRRASSLQWLGDFEAEMRKD
jgi:WD40 repeat protein